MNSEPKTKHISLRVDKDILDKLNQESDEKSLHLNTLLNKILRKHTSWNRYIPENGNITIWKLFPTLLMERYSLEEITKLTRKVTEESLRETILTAKQNFTSDAIREVWEEWVKANFNLEMQHQDQSYKYVISHGMGEKWSIYIAITSQTALEQGDVKNFTCQTTDNAVILSFDM